MKITYSYKLEATKRNYYALLIAITKKDMSTNEALCLMGLKKSNNKLKKRKIITQAEKDLILKLHNEGYESEHISNEVGRSHQIVQKILNSYGIYKNKNKTKESKEHARELLIELYKQGLNKKEIAKETGKSPATIYKNLEHLRRQGKI